MIECAFTNHISDTLHVILLHARQIAQSAIFMESEENVTGIKLCIREIYRKRPKTGIALDSLVGAY